MEKDKDRMWRTPFLIDEISMKYTKDENERTKLLMKELEREQKRKEKEKEVKPSDVFIGFKKPSKYKNINSSRTKKKK